MKDEDAYHIMPLHTFASHALHNFMDWVGIEHFTRLREDLPEFHRTPRLTKLVNSYRIQVYIQIYILHVIPYGKESRIFDHKSHLLSHAFSGCGEVIFYQCSITLVY